jgi:hypothetical protein
MELDYLLTRSGLTCPEVSSKVCHDSFCQPGSSVSALNMPVQRLKVAILPLDLPCSGPVTLSGEILTTVKYHRKKPDRFSSNDDMDVKNVSQFKHATWNIRGLAGKEEELDKILNKNDIQSLQKVKRNCKERNRLNITRLFTVEWKDTPEANPE